MRLIISRRETDALVGIDGRERLRHFGCHKKYFSLERTLMLASEADLELESCVLRKIGLCSEHPFYEVLLHEPTVKAKEALIAFREECAVFRRVKAGGFGIVLLAKLFGCSTQAIYNNPKYFPETMSTLDGTARWSFDTVVSFVDQKTQPLTEGISDE